MTEIPAKRPMVTRPAGPRKSAKKWAIHFQIMLANYASGIPFALLATNLASLLVKSLGLNLGLVDFRVGDGTTVISIAAALVGASPLSTAAVQLKIRRSK